MSIDYTQSEKSLQYALCFSSMGFPIFPCHSWVENCCTCDDANCSDAAKHPLTPHGFKDASLDQKQIAEWHTETQGLCNWAIATGNGMCVLDDDSYKNLQGLEPYKPLPETFTVETGGGGLQYYFRLPDGISLPCRTGILPGCDLKADGGYVIIPPSMHRKGNRYRLLTSWDTPLAPCPKWLIDLALGKTELLKFENADTPILTVATDLSNHAGANEGSRNHELCRLAGIHLARGEDAETIELLALAWAGRCNPPYPDNKARDTVRSLCKKHEAKSDNKSTHAVAADAVEIVQSADRKPQTVNADSISIGNSEEEEQSAVCGLRTNKPTLSADALHGVSGDIVNAVSPETEADATAILLTLLTGFGNAVGRNPHFQVGADRHGCNLFTLLIGDTSSSKGMAWGVSRYLLSKADANWQNNCLVSGLGSGEGLIERVRDATSEFDADSQKIVITDAGATDKRLLVQQEEFASLLKLSKREGNTVSDVLRQAWDGKPLEVLNRRKNTLRSTEAHISIVGMITADELAHCLRNHPDAVNGFSNRFLFCCCSRSKLLPSGGNIRVLDQFLQPLADAINKAKSMCELKRDADAETLWVENYPMLADGGNGAYGKATARARPQVMRLALVYALLDCSDFIMQKHLQAALALWDYCSKSAALVFSDNNNTISDTEPLEMLLLHAIETSPGISKTQLHEATGKKFSADARASALVWLQGQGLAYFESHPLPQGGPAVKCWYPGKPQKGVASVDTLGDRRPLDADDVKQSADRKPQTADCRPLDADDVKQSAAVCGEQKAIEANGLRSAVCGEQKAIEANGLRSAVCGEQKAIEANGLRSAVCGEQKAIEANGLRSAVCGEQKAIEANGLRSAVCGEQKAIEAKRECGFVNAYPDADSVKKAIWYGNRGKILKDEEGNCTLELPKPDLKLQAAWEKFGAEICSEYLTDAEFFAGLDAELLAAQNSAKTTEARGRDICPSPWLPSLPDAFMRQ